MKDLRYWNDSIEYGQWNETRFIFKITGAKAVAPQTSQGACLTAFDAIAAQATIDTFLGTTTEFNYLAFDATAMGTAAFACIANFGGQIGELLKVEVIERSSTDNATLYDATIYASATLTNSSLTNECAKGANGNVAVRYTHAGLDGLTAGEIEVIVFWKSK